MGIIPLIFAIFSMFSRHDKKTLFFGSLFFVSLIFSFPIFFAKLRFILNVPFLNSAQPTRLLSITDFCLSILAALGFDYFLKIKDKKKIFYSLGTILAPLVLLWVFVLYGNKLLNLVSPENIFVAKNNLFGFLDGNPELSCH